jgi:hypothetical protein
MTDRTTKSERHHALNVKYPPDTRYCRCKQGRCGNCTCEDYPPDPAPKWWVLGWFAVAAVAGLAALASVGASL